ncbi:MAG: RNA polymerase sigma factor RpoD, partial [Campylobacter sp.]|nr:RNA polymerase sigma factor RpoD [Campylobacter sp.]
MTTKELYANIEELFEENKKSYVTYEKLIKLFEKIPTATNAKKIESFVNKYEATLLSSARAAELRNIEDAQKLAAEAKAYIKKSENEKFDTTKSNEVLEWGRSDSPVRMYLREMGAIDLLTKEEEVEISKRIELGEDIIIDAFCSVPFLIDFILEYKEPLINRERRVKELFKNFDEDDGDEEKEEDEEFEENLDVKKDVKK